MNSSEQASPSHADTAVAVDVLMLAYNVEPFVAEAIEGVLAQRTTFPVRLIIAEDHATDGTLAICQRYADRHPDKVVVVPGGRNLGIPGRYAESIPLCTAKYIAMCDSDDRWCDPYKLAKQVAFLESHPDHGMCYTDVHLIDRQGQRIVDDGYDGLRALYASGDVFLRLLQANFINNSTIVARRALLADHVVDPERGHSADHFLWLHVAARSLGEYLPERTSEYRTGGITSSASFETVAQRKMKQRLGAILLDYVRQRPVPQHERPVIARKVIGVLARGGTPLRVKAALVANAARYLPGGIAGWRATFLKPDNLRGPQQGAEKPIP
jgi:hypothetical protein